MKMIELELPKDGQLLKVSDIAKYLNISRAMVYRLIQNGEIPVIRIKSAVRVRQADLQEFINKCRKVNNN
jgi:excisionase family DNA binding protein